MQVFEQKTEDCVLSKIVLECQQVQQMLQIETCKKDQGIMPKKQRKQISKDVLNATGKFTDAKLRVLVGRKSMPRICLPLI